MKHEKRKLYPRNWERLAWQCNEQAGWKCEYCHIRHGVVRLSRRTGAEYTVYLHAAHQFHDIGNPDPSLLCLCPACHGTYDYQHRMRQKQFNHERLRHHLLLSHPS